ncbi:MAG: Holliday junction branch migration protein RuvA [Acidobacteriota bacterium]
MIGRLTGVVAEATPDRVLLDVRDVGYEVHVPLSTYAEIERRAGDRADPGDARITLEIHTQVREDAITLFGFWTAAERQFFERLIAISGIGPRLAQAVLSGLPPGELARAIVDEDLRRLSAIPGIGKKTAARMAMELKDKVGDLLGAASGVPAAQRATASEDDDLALALRNLGYKPAAAADAAAAARGEAPDAPLADQLRRALRRLAKL